MLNPYNTDWSIVRQNVRGLMLRCLDLELVINIHMQTVCQAYSYERTIKERYAEEEKEKKVSRDVVSVVDHWWDNATLNGVKSS